MNEQEVLQMLGEVNAVITGSHIVYTSGQHGTAYVNKDAIYPYTRKTSKLCRGIAERFAGANVDVVLAPAVGGVILSQWTAFHLSEITDRDVMAVYAEPKDESVIKVSQLLSPRLEIIALAAEREDRDENLKTIILKEGDEVFVRHPEFIIKRGYDKFVKGKRVLVVDDVCTTGGSVRKSIAAVRAYGGQVIGAALLCNRGNVKAEDVSAPELYALLNIKFDSWKEEDCSKTGPCSRGVPINMAVGKGKDYLARKGSLPRS
ncbi:MAG: phosphoribosyltransferase family protein [Patescibacteria group bacterium]|nr:phosphoribosyltransferase family protein [Patescibacteria group bacterium]